MNIYQEEINNLRKNRAKFEALLKGEDFKNKYSDQAVKDVLVLFDRFESVLNNEESKKRDALILEGLPLFYMHLF